MNRTISTWRLASSVVGRRTALRHLAVGTVGAVGSALLAACGSDKPAASPFAVALGTFAIGSWTVTAPDAEFDRTDVDIKADGTWSATFTSTDSQSTDTSESAGSSGGADSSDSIDPETSSGTWQLTGGTLTVTFDDRTGTATGLPETVTAGTATFDWSLDGPEAGPIKASWDATTNTMTMVRTLGRGFSQTMVAKRRS